MKITCQTCAAKYTIADEKVAGKTVKIKCKKCGATIVVNGAEAGGYQAPAAADPSYGQQAPPHEHGGGEPDEEGGDGQTTVLGAEHAAQGAAAPSGGDWTVNVADDDQRTMSSAAIASAFASGTITNDTYVWRDGMSDWSPLSGVPELVALVSRPAPAAPAAAPRPFAVAPPPAAGVALGGTVMMNESAPAAAAAPAAAPAPAAARRAAVARPEKADPFQASEQAAAAAAPPPPPKAHAVGERNENSMLFSISALTAAKDARDKERSGPKNGGRSGVDDILNLGGGASPILAPPPLLAPIVEPPPMAAPVAPAMVPGMGPQGYGAGAPMQQPMGYPPGAQGMDDVYPQKKKPIGLIVGIVAGLAVVGGVAVFFMTGTGKEGTTPDATAVTASASPTQAPTTPSAIAVNTATAPTTAAPTETSAAASASGTPAGGTQAGSKTGGPGPTGPTGPAGAVSAKPAASAAPTAAPAATPTAAPTTAPGPSEGAEFNRGAATSALGAAAGAAKGCKKPDGPTGSGKVKVTFAPSGNVTSAQVEGPPFAGTPVGGCIASAFRGAHVPPFSGPPVSVSKTVTIN